MAIHVLGLTPWEFERVIDEYGVAGYEEMVKGAVHRHLLLADLFGHLRVDVLRAAGVTFSDTPAPSKLKPGEKVPTFELLMGRKPVDFWGLPEPEPEPVMSDKARRGKAMIEASKARKTLRQAAKARMQPGSVES